MSYVDPDVQELLDETMDPFLQNQSKIDAPLYGEKWLEHVPYKGRTMEVKIRAGHTSEIGTIQDGLAYDIEGARTGFSIINQTGSIVFGKLKMSMAEASQTHDSASVIDLVRETLTEFSETYLSFLDNQMIYGGVLEGSISADMVTAFGTGGAAGYDLLNAATESAPVVIPVGDPGKYQIGQAIESYSIVTATGVATLQARAIITAVTPNFDTGVHTISLYGLGVITATLAPAAGTTNPVQLCQRGAYASGSTTRVAMIGLAQACDASFDLYGFDRESKNWKPQSHDAGGGAITGSRLRRMAVQLSGQRAGGKKFALMNSDTLNTIHEEVVADRRITGVQFDPTDYNQTGSIGSMNFKIDDNMGSTELFIVDPDHVKLGVNQSLITDGEGAPGKDKGEMSWLPTPGEFNVETQKWAIHQLNVTRRSCLGSINNLG